MNQAETMHEKRARLRAELDVVDAALEAEAEAAKAEALEAVRELMLAHGITLDDIDSKPAKRELKTAERRRTGTYVHPDGRTHVEKPGRGRRPGWLDDDGVVTVA